MSSKPIKTVLVIGATGSIGPPIVNALRSHPQGYTVSILTRPGSFEKTRGMFPDPEIKIFTADYSSLSVTDEAFKPSFEGQDAVVSATATFTVSQQIAMVDAAIAVKSVQRFIPSEYGIDTCDSKSLKEHVPVAYLKTDVVSYLQSHESSISWSAMCTGAFFDWSFQYPGLMGWNLPSRIATIFDGGDIPYEATNIAQIGSAVAAVLSSTASPGFPGGTAKSLPMIDITKNKYVYVNSFTTTQNAVLHLLEKHIGGSFQVQPANGAEVAKDGLARSAKSVPGFRPTGNLEYADGVAETIFAALYGTGNLNHFSETKGLWNQALGLKSEDLEETVKEVVESLKKRDQASQGQTGVGSPSGPVST